jgi:hypothetical protein
LLKFNHFTGELFESFLQTADFRRKLPFKSPNGFLYLEKPNVKLMNQIWIMTSAFDQLDLDQTIEKAKEAGVQGLDVCVFRKDGTRDDFVATHMDYENFGPEMAKEVLKSSMRPN